jgi:hypothetical protein
VSKEGAYSIRSGAKLFWVIFWSFQQAWLACFSGLVALAMFGEQAGQGGRGLLSMAGEPGWGYWRLAWQLRG